MGGDSLSNVQIDRSYLEQIVGGIVDIEKWGMDKILFHVYDAVYIKYNTKFYQEQMMRVAVEKRMIKKNITIDMMSARVAQLESICVENGIELPKQLTEDEAITNVRARLSKDSKEEAK